MWCQPFAVCVLSPFKTVHLSSVQTLEALDTKHFLFCFFCFFSSSGLPTEEEKEGGAERDGNRSAAPAAIHTRWHTSLCPDEVFFGSGSLHWASGGKSGVTEVSHRCSKTFVLFSFSCQLPQVGSFSPPRSCSLYFSAPLRTADANHFPARMHRSYRSSSSPPRTVRDERGKRRWAFKLSSPLSQLNWSSSDNWSLLMVRIWDGATVSLLGYWWENHVPLSWPWKWGNEARVTKGLRWKKKALPALAVGFIWSIVSYLPWIWNKSHLMAN